MAQLFDDTFEKVNAELPRPLADRLKRYVDERGITKNKARVVREVIEGYLDSSDSRISVLEAQVKALRSEIDSLKH